MPVQTSPSVDVQRVIEQGNMQLARKDFNGAREIFVQAEAAIPENPDVLLGLCRVAYGTQKEPRHGATRPSGTIH